MTQKIIRKITNFILNKIDFKQDSINRIIKKEIINGGRFEKLIFPLKNLNELKVIQFFNTHPKYGMIAGLGADKNIEMAYLKSIVEYFERVAYFKNNVRFNLLSTNGMAGHRIKSLAKKKSLEELLERDSFLRHWYSNTSFKRLEMSSSEKELNSNLNLIHIEMHLCETYLGHQKTVACFLEDQSTSGFALGLSAGREKNDREKAIQEALINYFFGHQGFSEDTLINNIRRDGINTLLDHRAFWLYMNPMPDWLFKDQFQVNKKMKTEDKFSYNFNILESTPFEIVLCSTEDLLELRIGKICEKNIHLLTKNGLDVVLGNTYYHPIP